MCAGKSISHGASWGQCLSPCTCASQKGACSHLPGCNQPFTGESQSWFHHQSILEVAVPWSQHGLPAPSFPPASARGALLWALSTALSVCNWVWLDFGSLAPQALQWSLMLHWGCSFARAHWAAVPCSGWNSAFSGLPSSAVSQVDQGWFAFGKLHNCKCKLHNCGSTKDNGKNAFDLLMLFHVLHVAVNFFLITL